MRMALGRLRAELVQRADDFSHRVVDVVELLESAHRHSRIVSQLVGCGTSVAANTCEADEALSRANFCKTIGIVLKELVETRYWLGFVARRGWVKEDRLTPLITEASELKLVYGSILSKSRQRSKAATK